MWLNLSNASKWWDVQVRPSVQENTDCVYKHNLQIIFCRIALQAACGHIVYTDCLTSVDTWTPYHQEGRIYFAPMWYTTNKEISLPSQRRKSRAEVRLICPTDSLHFHLKSLQKLKGFWGQFEREHRGRSSLGCAVTQTVHNNNAVLLLWQIMHLHRVQQDMQALHFVTLLKVYNLC